MFSADHLIATTLGYLDSMRPDEIAEHLARCGYRGMPALSTMGPLAAYLRSIHPDLQYCVVGNSMVSVRFADTATFYSVPLPESVRTFQRRFDTAGYPMLVGWSAA